MFVITLAYIRSIFDNMRRIKLLTYLNLINLTVIFEGNTLHEQGMYI